LDCIRDTNGYSYADYNYNRDTVEYRLCFWDYYRIQNSLCLIVYYSLCFWDYYRIEYSIRHSDCFFDANWLTVEYSLCVWDYYRIQNSL